MSKPLKKAYIAGPLFDEGERWWIESVEQFVADAGFETFLPHRDNPPKDQFNVRAIFERLCDAGRLATAQISSPVPDWHE